jgi:DNA polymerase I-like protein with 3'-5' exonuclease and polymerase domains
MTVQTVLLDARAPDKLWDQCVSQMRDSLLTGIDCETQDEARHPGLNAYNNKKRHVFDHRRTTMTGFSLYADGSDQAWYVNLAHADSDNRVGRERALTLIDQINPQAVLLAHNAKFEHVMFEQCLDVVFKNPVVCTLQMAVSDHGPDEYEWSTFINTPLPMAFRGKVKDILQGFANYDRDKGLTGTQSELLGSFISKTSTAAHSYNGWTREMAIGFNLKKLVMSLFGHQMTTYEQVLNGKAHMGELTGPETVNYGAEDAYWVVPIFKHYRDKWMRENPTLLKTFLTQENPMTKQVFANSWRDGLKLNDKAIHEGMLRERANMATAMREFKALIRQLLPFPQLPNEKLLEKQSWYAKNWPAYRKRWVDWANSKDSSDDFEQTYQVSGPVGNAWALEKGLKERSNCLNPGYYMAQRVLLHDLMGLPLVYIDGEIKTDKEARGKLLMKAEKAENELHQKVLKAMNRIATIEQVMKLYLTPYNHLMDPETSRVYPDLSSMLATRRMAASFPNPMQLSKQGETTYIRGFYEGDTEDHFVVSADWSSVELVLIGDQSGDQGFSEVFGQLPYGDLHTGAAADCLAVKTLPGLTEAEYREFKFGRNPNNRRLLNVFSGEEMDPGAFYKHTRGTPVGKGANFNYWYSGSLSTVGANLGWSSEEMWEAVERYRNRFPLAEAWRVATQDAASRDGFVVLPDGHRRVRFEATEAWANAMLHKFADVTANPALLAYADLACRRLRSRARNQAVNAMIQGTCATLAKRSILRVLDEIEKRGWQKLVRIMMPIHDELVCTVHKSIIMEFIPVLRQCMTEHKDIVTTLPLDCTVAIGKTFLPYDKNNPKMSQIELDEAAVCGPITTEWEGKKLPDDKVREVVEWLLAA